MKIISLDGGGLRGILSSIILGRLEANHPGFLSQADLMAGTSTGGILALALAVPFSPQVITSLYEKKGPLIFKHSAWRGIASAYNLWGAEYDNAGLRDALVWVFGTISLQELKTKVVVPTFKLDAPDGWKPKIFHNFPGPGSDGPCLAVDVALRTSSAPTYFPTFDGYVDGGVCANNPSMVAVAQALDPRNGSPARLEDIKVLSMGTGSRLGRIEGKRHDWGASQWARPLLDILIDGVSEISDFQCSQLLGNRYARVQVDFPEGENISMDDVRQLPRMKEMAEHADLDQASDWIARNWT